MCNSEYVNLFYVQRGFYDIRDLSLCFNRLRRLFDCYRICCYHSFLGVTEKARCSNNSSTAYLFSVQMSQTFCLNECVN